jgi:hypothetical protein
MLPCHSTSEHVLGTPPARVFSLADVWPLCCKLCRRVVVTNRDAPESDNAFLNAWVGLPILWAILNGIAPYLFIHYCFSGGSSFSFACKTCRLLTNLLTVGALVLVFFSIPQDYDVPGAFTKSVDFINKQRVSAYTGVTDRAVIRECTGPLYPPAPCLSLPPAATATAHLHRASCASVTELRVTAPAVQLRRPCPGW